MDDSALDQLFSGDLNKLVSLPKRVVRLFISSTFTDLTLERNSLMERVYPRLKKYCRERHGLDFQVVDMRWGVRDEATDDHQTANLCSREIEYCQRMSLGPNFVALLGDKYGFRPLCNRIKSNEYRALRRCLIEMDINTDFLDTWYKEDMNAVPPEYLLQPISSILKNFTNKEEPELQSIDQRIWMAIQGRLHELLLIGSGRLVKQGRMSEQEQLMKYSISVTEREVIEGCLNVNEANSQCLIYVRTISNLHDHLEKCLATLARGVPQQLDTTERSEVEGSNRRDSDSPSRKASLKIGDDTISLTTSVVQTAAERKVERNRRLIGRYIDLISKDNVWMLDDEAQEALANLKENKLKVKLRDNYRNLTHYKLLWHEQDGISLKSDEHKQYLNDLTEHFYSNLVRMIRKASKQESRLKCGLMGEVLQHSHYSKHVSRSFLGRNEELDKIRSYIIWSLAASQQAFAQLSLPMFVYGAGGSGKTSILARAATLAHEWIVSSRQLLNPSNNTDDRWDQKPCIITRFCGTTPASSSMMAMLTSVCRQLQFNFYQYGPLNGAEKHIRRNPTDLEEAQLVQQPIPHDLVRLVFTFRQLIDNCQHELHRNRLFVIIIDSVERLSSPVESSVKVKYSWLTSITRLPINVRLIVSCSSEKSTGTDYQWLKRHFIQTYFKRLQSSAGSISLIQSLGVDSRTEGMIEQVTGPTLDVKSSIKMESLRENENYHKLKRLVLPAARLLRVMRKGANLKVEGEYQRRSSSHVGHFEGWSLSSRPRRRVASMPFMQLEEPNKSRPLADHNVDQGGSETSSFKVDNNEPLAQLSFGLNLARSAWLLHVKPMGVELAMSVVQHWLADMRRTLTQQQWSLVERSLSHCSRPIFVKLAFGELINWKSYSTESDSQGLTFGSSLLVGCEQQLSHLLMDPSVKRLMLDSEQLDGGDQFKLQLLTVEQQWLNYLDHSQRKEQAIVESDSKDETLVIKVGAYGNSTTSKSKGGDGSYTNCAKSLSAAICHLPNNIDDAISQLFARIELQHGYLLTKHSFSYINAARNGICENELEDILSLDDVVLDDVFQYHLPPVRRIPPLLWTRIRNDLPDYLSERDADGIVIDWHHNQFKQVTQCRYMCEQQHVLYIHSIMADYFLGYWADKPKQFRCTRQQVQRVADQFESTMQQSLRDSLQGGRYSGSQSGGRFASGSGRSGASFSVRSRLRSSDQQDQRFQWMQAKADRRVPHQPLSYDLHTDSSSATYSPIATILTSSTGRLEQTDKKRRYNLRKLSELPHHLLLSGRYLELADNCLFNYKWLFASLEAMGLQAILSDFEAATIHLERLFRQLQTRIEVDNESIEGQPESAAGQESRRKDMEMRGAIAPDQLGMSSLVALIRQLNALSNTVRLSSSVIQSDARMLAPQLIGRLLPLLKRHQGYTQVNNHDIINTLRDNPTAKSNKRHQDEHLMKLVDQCYTDGSSECSLLPTDQFLQTPDGLQLTSLEGHPFAITSMIVASDRRHLLAVSNRFIMWDISTGEMSFDIEPEIGGSIMRQLKMGLSNEYAVAYTSDDTILVLDILTQQVCRYKPKLETTIASDGNQQQQQIVGLDLADKLEETTFVVWTRTSWFVLSIVNDVTSNQRQSDLSHRLVVELVYSFTLSSFNCERGSISSIGILMEPQRDEHINLVTLTNDPDRLGPDNIVTISLITLTATKGHSGEWTLERWKQKQPIDASSMALNEGLNRVVFANATGELYLSRMRSQSWSRAKRLEWRCDKQEARVADTIGLTEDGDANRAPMAIELSSGHSEQPVSHSLASSDELSAVAEFERQIDGIKSNDEIGNIQVFERPDEKSGEEQAPLKPGKSRKGRLVCSTGITYIRLYHANRIDVLRLLTRQQLNGQQKVSLSRLYFPDHLGNISVEPNKCQVKSIIIGHSDGQQHYLAASIGRKILIYNMESEQCLRLIDNAHSARIVELASIIVGSSYTKIEDNGQLSSAGDGLVVIDANKSLQLCFASASMDRTVKIWNLANLSEDIS